MADNGAMDEGDSRECVDLFGTEYVVEDGRVSLHMTLWQWQGTRLESAYSEQMSLQSALRSAASDGVRCRERALRPFDRE